MHHAISFTLRIAYACFFGFVLLAHTADIVTYIPQLLGGLLMLESISQLIELFTLKFRTEVHWGYFVTPGVCLLYSLILCFICEMPADLSNLLTQLSTMFKLKLELKLVGLCFVAFILSELVISIRFFMPLYRPKKFFEEQKMKAEMEAANAEITAEEPVNVEK